MADQALVTYFYQSAFTVAMEKTLMVFSYGQFDEKTLPIEARLSDRDFQGFNNILVFVPNKGVVHHDPVIYEWKRSYPITYILPQELSKEAPRTANVRLCKEGDSFSIGHCEVSVFGSTDSGVSYLAQAEGRGVFHAGDLNLWHWREENSLREIARAEAEYYEKVASIPRGKVDIAFFPLDPNQGGFYDAGANHFIMAVRPKVFFPMHFGHRTEIAAEYARRGLSRHTVVYALTQPKESAQIDFAGMTPQVRSTAAQKGGRSKVSHVDLSAYTHEDPFAQTDLPVNLKEQETGAAGPQ